MHVVLAAIVLLTGADSLDRQKLRQCIPLPHITLTGGVNMAVTCRGEIILAERSTSLPAEIAAAEMTLRGDGTDADRFRALGELYDRAGQNEKAQAARMTAANLYRAQLTGRPRDGLLLAHYADCLESRHLRERDQAEALLRQAVQIAPAEWECCVLLGALLEQKANDVLAGEESAGVPLLPAALERRGREGHITAEAARQANDCFTESLRCFDRAVAVAPREPRAYLARAGFRNNRAMGFMIGKIACGLPVDTYPSAIWAECCADLWRAADLKPDDWLTLGTAGMYEVMQALLADKEKKLVGRDPVPVASEAAMKDALARLENRGVIVRLEQLAAGTEPRGAARIAELLSMFYLYRGDRAKVEESLARAVRLDPALDHAWDMRIGFLSGQNRPEEMLAVSRERVRHRDSARNRFLLARACAEAKRPEESIAVLEAALQREPDHLLCNLTLAALLMSRDDRELQRAGELLDRAERTMWQHPAEEDVRHYAVLRIAFLALTGQTERLHEHLRQLSPERRADSRMQELLKVLAAQLRGN